MDPRGKIIIDQIVLRIRIRCLFFDPWIRDPGWVKSQDPISESLETILWV